VSCCVGPVAADDDASESVLSSPPDSPIQTVKSTISVGATALRQEVTAPSDASVAEEDGAAPPIEDPDAAIHAYLDPKREFEYYDQGEAVEETAQDEDADASQLEVVETPEADQQSVTAEEVPENPEASESLETSEAVANSESGDLETVSQPAVVDAPAALENPSVSKQSKSRTPIVTSKSEAKKYLFPKLTPVEVFENYLQDVEEMSYETLYNRATRVAGVLLELQTEFVEVDKKLYRHEMIGKAETKRAAEDAKEEADRRVELEDMARDAVEEKYSEKLALEGEEWEKFLEKFNRSSDKETLKHLNNLHNPQFMEAAIKRRRKAAAKYHKLDNEPPPETKPTKEEIEQEKRKQGWLIDPVKFDDQKRADVYGLEYSSHFRHHGHQPIDRIIRQAQQARRKVNGDAHSTSEDTAGSAPIGRLRMQRNKSKRAYEAERSATSEEDEEELPAKRLRKPRRFEDGVEALGKPRGSTQSRGGTPMIRRRFPSGAPVGRPPRWYIESKLQAVQMAPKSPELTNGDLPQTSQEAAPSDEGQLQGVAEPLANQTVTVSDNATATAPTTKRKHPGGRPKKVVAEAPATNAPSEDVSVEASQSKPKNKGGRPRKHPVQEPAPAEASTQSGPQPRETKSKAHLQSSTIKVESGFDDDLVQLTEAEDIIQSTEQDDGSRYNSAETSRPTSSSSTESVSTVANRRSARPSTRNKTLARELNGTKNANDDTGNKLEESPSSSPSVPRNKRKHDSEETELNPIVVDAPLQTEEPAPKKRRTRAPKAKEDMVETPVAMGAKSKRKRANSDALEEDRVGKKGKKSIHEPAGIEDDHESNADIDEESLTPAAREELKKKRAKEEKSRKLSESTKARWASGGMKKAQETRKANLALKKAAKEAAAKEAAAAAESSGPAPIEPAAPAPAIETPEQPAPKKQKAQKPKPSLEPTRPASTRIRKPTRHAAGLDGAADEDEDELAEQFRSEYDRYQALTSAGSPGLGKRVRKPLIDLSAVMDETSEDEYYQ
jgi:hypothetical protein